MSQRDYTLTLNENELRTILKALGRQPFAEVYELVEKLVRATDTTASGLPPTKAPAKNGQEKIR